MGNTALVQARVDPELRRDVIDILAQNGLDLPTAIRMFLTKVRRVGGLPFEIGGPRGETFEAIEEARRLLRDPTARSFGSFAEILADSGVER
ncbi:MAG: type II toxin-antitoxin system RelB/DinJ family antitoxin [Bifidobacteriaceae bacterium]|jgi:DNA-damage-inducible protein J|nr:type II toxin-antitoxin system RelB/DinJ family antitoxin [Bifidobacteriaceae bacterium]